MFVALDFLDRDEERARLRALLDGRGGTLGVIYGRRRLGKSRLLREVLPAGRSIYYVADDRESTLQRASLAAEIARILPGFDRVTYPEWDALLARFWAEAPAGTVLAIDELPALVSAAREIPSLLQRLVDRGTASSPHLILTGSSQRMMHGLVLDREAPLYGRAKELLRIRPLPAGWIRRALRIDDDHRAIETYAVWGGVPRYWELAAEHDDLDRAVRALVLAPLGVLHDEPMALLLDDLREIAQAASILNLVGQGCHRLSEIAGRLGKPATALTRPIDRLLGLELLRREIPFGASPRDSKRTLYRIADPFLQFWFRFVEPNHSRLEAGQATKVAADIRAAMPHHVASVWEELVRDSVLRADYGGHTWRSVGRFWGPGLDRQPLELDVVAESDDGKTILVGECKWTAAGDWRRIAHDLERKAQNLPLAAGRKVVLGIWAPTVPAHAAPGVRGFGPTRVLAALR